ncbi:MAG: insulinase family protein [Actinobacteria bacterium]|nr:insulinase family protein [Actinomycetota bacterium]
MILTTMTHRLPTKTVLDSGVRVLSEHIPEVRSVSLGIWIDTGSRDENDGEVGLTHLLEHLLFKGTPGMNARDIAEAFDYMGADLNGATGKEHTSVYSRVLEEYLPRAVEITFSMVRNPLLDHKDIDSERQVVLEEIAMHLDSPDELVHDYLSQVMWGEHPAGHMVLGDTKVIKNVERDSVVKFYGDRYVGSRILVAAAGAVEHDRLCEIIQDRTDSLQIGAPAVRDDSLERPLSGSRVIYKDTEQVNICIGSRGLHRGHPDRFALAVLDNILGGSMSSRLFQTIREERGLAYSIYSYTGMMLGMGMVGIYCGTHPSQAQKVIELIEEVLSGIKENGLKPDEVERAKNHIKGALLISMEDSGNRMNRMTKAEFAESEHLTIDEIVKRVERVGSSDIDRVFEDTWGSVGASLAVVGPLEDGSVGLSGSI